jgi:iron complex transport system ATP-binding protein
MLRAEQIALTIHGRRLLAPMDLRFSPGTVHAVFGPNGAGKSSLLKLLAREWRPSAGSLSLGGTPLADWPSAALARQRAVLPQQHALTFPFSAREVVELGRLHAMRGSAAQERAITDAALDCCGAAALGSRRYTSLSGGERARVHLARVLAQIWTPPDGATRYLLLDEPTTHLDLAFQHSCLALARDWARKGACVIAVLHDPNLVLAYADHVSVLAGGALHAQGTPADTLTPELMRTLYGLDSEALTGSGGASWLAVRASSGTAR